MQPQPDDEYLIHISMHKAGKKIPRREWIEAFFMVPAKDFDLTPAGFATKHLHNAAANLLQEFHDRNATG